MRPLTSGQHCSPTALRPVSTGDLLCTADECSSVVEHTTAFCQSEPVLPNKHVLLSACLLLKVQAQTCLSHPATLANKVSNLLYIQHLWPSLSSDVVQCQGWENESAYRFAAQIASSLVCQFHGFDAREGGQGPGPTDAS